MENSQKRKTVETIISLDAEYSEHDPIYNYISEKSLETEIMEAELLTELLENVSEKQRKIAVMKMDIKIKKSIHF